LRWLLVSLLAVGVTWSAGPVCAADDAAVAAAGQRDNAARPKCHCAKRAGQCCGSACCRLQTPPPEPKPTPPSTARHVRTQPIVIAIVASFATTPLALGKSSQQIDIVANSAAALSLQSQAVRIQV
jgi:hypothetical protein